ncbi:MAG: AAA family ATPase [Pikeienuella sp.]
MMPQSDIKADLDTVTAHLAHITRRWGELDEPCLLELVFLTAEDKARVRQVMHYTPDDNGIAMAASDVATWNKMQVNAYATVNPVSERNRPEAHRRAKAANIVASFFHWADADDERAAENIRQFVGPKCNFFVLTGTVPSLRPHTYWELEDPTRNFEAWGRTQKSIAQTLQSDESVVDAPRIMRIAGAINWPKPQKQAKGYVPELVALKFYNDRPLVTSEQMARAFPGGSSTSPVDSGGGLQIDTGGHAPGLDTASTIASALNADNWNPNVNKLVWRLASLGLSDSEIMMMAPSLTLPGYSVDETQTEMATMLGYARDQGHGAKEVDTQFRDLTDAEKDAIPAALFKAWKRKDLSAIPTPQFVYSDFYARKYTSVTLAAPKVGKSMLGLAEAVDMATGRGLLTGAPREKLKVVYYNAEDDQDVIDNRVSALLTEYGLDQGEIEDWLFPQSGVDHENFYMVSGQEGVLNEALFVSIEKFITESGADVLIFDPLQDLSRSPETNEVFRLLGQRLRRMASTTGVALGLIHHTRKVAPGVTPSIDDMRGGSALRGTARFNRILVSMTEDEAAQAGVENHRYFFRIGDIESNLAPPSSDVNRWYEKVSVNTPAGKPFGAVKAWTWPDAFTGVTKQDAARVRHEVDAMATPPRADIRSSAWVGNVVANALGVDLDTKSGKAKVKALLSGWVKSDVLRIVTDHDKRAGREVNVVVCGANNPLVEGGDA